MSKGISLHIGLNFVDPQHYEGWDGELYGCINDAKALAAIANDVGFEASQLQNEQATAKVVIGGINAAARQLEQGDIFLLTYSGHGGQVPDRNGDDPDGRDETWVLHDRQLVDDELYALWGNFASGVRVFMLSDSCHSGSVSRALYERVSPIEAEAGSRPTSVFRSKAMPRDVQSRTYRAHKSEYDAIQDNTLPREQVDVKATVLLISGCQDNQLSSDGDLNGLFTERLLQVWKEGQFAGDYQRFHKQIKSLMPSTQTPNYLVVGVQNPAFEKQKPFTIGLAEVAQIAS